MRAMHRPWQPEQEVTSELAARLIAEQFPELQPRSVEPFGVGWDNTAYLVDETWVFRFPRRELAVELIRNESALLPALASELPLAIPDPRHVGRPSQAFGWPFAGYRLIPGRTACSVSWAEGERARTATALARFLRALHDFPAERARARGATGDTIRRLDLEYRRTQVAERIEHAVEQGLVESVDAFDGVLDDLPDEFTPRADTLVHGDLYARHLLVDDEHRLTGVIDWGDVHVGDPALDLGIVFGFLPPGARASFFDEYGDISPRTRAVARFKALHHGLHIALYAADIGDEDLLREGHLALAQLR